MRNPRLIDNGQTLEIDLHGLFVDDAIRVIKSAVDVARERGRSTLRLIHGSSTSDAVYNTRTIKHALADILSYGISGVTGHHMMDDITVLSLASGTSLDPTPITNYDLR